MTDYYQGPSVDVDGPRNISSTTSFSKTADAVPREITGSRGGQGFGEIDPYRPQDLNSVIVNAPFDSLCEALRPKPEAYDL